MEEEIEKGFEADTRICAKCGKKIYFGCGTSISAYAYRRERLYGRALHTTEYFCSYSCMLAGDRQYAMIKEAKKVARKLAREKDKSQK